MKIGYTLLLLVGFSCFTAFGQYTAYDPATARFDWFLEDIVVDEVGHGVIDTANIVVTLEDQSAIIEYHLWLRAVPNAQNENEDNDSLELRTNFTMDDLIVFNHIEMRMHDTIRQGRVISKGNALRIWNNIVYDFSVPMDPGILYKEGNQYYLRAFPVGAEEHAYLKLTAVIPLTHLSSTKKGLTIPMELIAAAQNPVRKAHVEISLGGNYSALAETSASGLVWTNPASGSFIGTISNSELSGGLTFELETVIEHKASVGHFSDSTGDYLIHALNNQALIDGPGTTDYLIMIDADIEDLYNKSSTEYFENHISESLNKVFKAMDAEDRFMLYVQGNVFYPFKNSWSKASPEMTSLAVDFAMSQAGSKSDPVDALSYAEQIMGSQPGQIILVTSHSFQSSSKSREEFEELAQTLDMKHRTDVLHLNRYGGPTSITELSESSSISPTFFMEVAYKSNGFFRYAVNIGDQADFIKPTIQNIDLGSNTEVESYIMLDNKSQTLFLCQQGTFVSSTDPIMVNYTNGESKAIMVNQSREADSSPSLKQLYGIAKLDHFSATYTGEHLGDRYCANQSVAYGILTDYSALLVVEADSQYNDTLGLTFNPPFPLGQDENLTASSTINLFPNPATEEVTISFANNEVTIERLEVFNLHGEAVVVESCNKSNVCNINVRDLCPGVYFVQVLLDSGRHIQQKLVIE